MVVALAAGGGSYYVWQQHLIAEQDRHLLKQSIERLLEVVEQKDQTQQTRIEQLALHHHHDVEKRLDTLEQSLPELGRQLSQQQRNWNLAEVDYLLRLADQRLQLSHDIPTAITALQQAQEQLTNYTNGQYVDVTANIAQLVQILSALSQNDSAAIVARLSALLITTKALPYTTPAGQTDKLRQAPAPAAGGASPLAERIQQWGRVVWHDLKSLVTIRRNSEVSLPLLNPQQRYLLQTQLNLKLETARLAALAHNQPLYHASLQEAAEWVRRYYDTSASAVTETLTTLGALAEINVDPELPSLQVLRQQLQAARPPVMVGMPDAEGQP
jgi:uroporphyrin-3 C-methyltransferase